MIPTFHRSNKLPMSNRYRTTLAIGAALLTAMSFGQDTLFYVNGNRIPGKVEEIGIEQIRYITSSDSTSILVFVEKRELSKIKLQGGQEFVFQDIKSTVTPPPSEDHRKHVIALDILAPALNHAVIGYEQMIDEHMSLQVKVGYIGLWGIADYNTLWNSTGGMAKVGVKFILPPSARRVSPTHPQPLVGWYLKPEFMYSAWKHRHNEVFQFYPYYGTSTYSDDHQSAAFNVVVGRQVLLGGRISFDLFTGLGYGVRWRNGNSSNDDNNDRQDYSFSHAFVGRFVPLTLSGGMTFGVAF